MPLTPLPEPMPQYDQANEKQTRSLITQAFQQVFSNLQAVARKFFIKSYSEFVATPVIAANVLTLDLSTGDIFRVALTSNVTTLTIKNPPAAGVAQTLTLILDIGGNFTVTWPASIHWAGGSAPVQTAVNGKTDIVTFVTTNQGVTWYGFVGGLAYVT